MKYTNYPPDLSVVEFVMHIEGMDIMPDQEEIARELINPLSNGANHYGDCTSQNITCQLCTATFLLNEYREYCIEKEMIWHI